MNTQYVTIAIAVLCFTMPVGAQQTNAEGNKLESPMSSRVSDSSEDKALLRALLGEFTTLSASFMQTITNMQGQELQQSVGELLLKKPQKLRWTVTSPEESLLIADGNTVYNVDPFVEQVTLLDQSSLTKSNPLMLLITDEEVQWAQVAVTKTKNSYTLLSLAPDSPISKLVLEFNMDRKLLSIVSLDRQQQRNKLIFSNVKHDLGIDATDFTFTPNSTWIVDDQRQTPISE
jgi:outer membrane lipoprotein carrier protein